MLAGKHRTGRPTSINLFLLLCSVRPKYCFCSIAPQMEVGYVTKQTTAINRPFQANWDQARATQLITYMGAKVAKTLTATAVLDHSNEIKNQHSLKLKCSNQWMDVHHFP